MFQVKDRGAGRFEFVLQDDRFLIKVRGARGKALPLAFVQTRSEFLASVGPVHATDAARRVVELLGVIEAEPTVSRIDLTADFTSSMAMDSWDRSAWITRAEHRHAHAMGDNFSGWSIGLTGPVGFGLYDKLLEVVTRSKKTYLFPLWQQRGWFPGDQVWRAEFQLRRPVLAQFGLTTLPETLKAIPSLWQYLTSEWLRLAVTMPEDENRARWPVHPFWERLQQLSWEGESSLLTRVYRSVNLRATNTWPECSLRWCRVKWPRKASAIPKRRRIPDCKVEAIPAGAGVVGRCVVGPTTLGACATQGKEVWNKSPRTSAREDSRCRSVARAGRGRLTCKASRFTKPHGFSRCTPRSCAVAPRPGSSRVPRSAAPGYF